MKTTFMSCRRWLARQARLVSLLLLSAGALPQHARAQVNSGSDGHDGAFNPTTNAVIDMADHPDGVYHYTSVNIPAGVTVTFIPNPNNTPVVWLLQSNCVVDGVIDISGAANASGDAATGGPGGGRGGTGGSSPTRGFGIGGGDPGGIGSSASFGSAGYAMSSAAPVYGSEFLLPLFGGSGGGGGSGWGGGGGGGALLIAANDVTIRGSVNSRGGAGNGPGWNSAGGAGSGGGLRLVCNTLRGTGTLSTQGGAFFCGTGWGSYLSGSGGRSRVRIDCLDYQFGGSFDGCELSRGFQPIVFLVPGQGVQLDIASVAGVAVPANPAGVLVNPDIIVPAQQANPLPVVVHCSNIPLNTEVTVEVHPTIGSIVRAVGLNTVGTLASSTATVSVNMPRGGGILFAKTVTGINSNSFASVSGGAGATSMAQTGWTADGERFVAVEVTASLGGGQQLAYLTASGKRYKVPAL